jgi:Asp-tRNA(Asn)/Glu-tRNA(Gln) amidotransferase A subunit family amidase
LFGDIDLLIAPATPCPAPAIGQATMVLDGVEMPTRPNIGLFTQPISCAGLPVVCTPAALPGELPMGVQLVAAPWREALCLRAARYLEQIGVSRPATPHSAILGLLDTSGA